MLSTALPLVPARLRYGGRAFGLGVLALLLIALALVAQSPPSLRRGGVALALILVVLCAGVSVLSLMWAWLIVWPGERRRLQRAQPLHTDAAVWAGSAGPLAVLVVGGLLVGILLWAFLNTVGLVGAPMLWIVVGTINLEVARRVRRVERAEQVTYYETPATVPFRRAQAQELFVRLPQREHHSSGRREQGAAGTGSKARRAPRAATGKAKG
jgi:hypothetical protein